MSSSQAKSATDVIWGAATNRVVAKRACPPAAEDPLTQADELIHCHFAQIYLFLDRRRRRFDLGNAPIGIAAEKRDGQQAERDDGEKNPHPAASFQ